MKTINLTAAERRTMGNILAQGGCSDLTQGANRPGSIRKSVVAQLERCGFVECVTSLDLSGWPVATYYATAAGCLAFGAEIAKVA